MSLLKHTWHHLRRSPFQSSIAILIMSQMLFIVSGFSIISSGLSKILKYFETKPEITIFLKDGLDKATVENFQKELASYPSIKEIKYLSKEKALSLYKEQNKDNPLLTEMVTASILPASFEVSVSDPKILEQISQNISTKTNIVDEIIYQKDMINSLLRWTNLIRQAGLILTVLIALTAFLITSVIIGMKVTNRKDEIRVSRLLGASKFYVQRPFLLEGVIYGCLGSLIGTIFSSGLAIYFRSQINTFFQPIVFLPYEPTFYLTIFAITTAIGIVIGYGASLVSVKRYIKF